MKWTVEDTVERAEFRAEFREWLAGALPDGWVDAIDSGDEEAFSAAREGWNFLSWMGTIGGAGYAAPLWPEEYGGLSGEQWMQQVLREEMRRYRLPTVNPNLLGTGLAGPTIIEHGTEEQKQKHLKPILAGNEIWCQLFSEPGSGSDLASLSTRAEHDGDEWIVNGQKVWTTIAQFANYGMLVTRTDPDKPKHEGLTYFILPMKSEGVDVRPLKQMTGSAEFNEVYLDNVRIPDSNRVGDVGDGWRVARTTLANERVALAGISLDRASITGGTSKDPWQSFVEDVGDTSDPLVRQHVAQLYIESEVKEITAFRANAARMSGAAPGPEGSVNKVFNAEYNQRRSSFLVNASGASAMAWDPGDNDASHKSEVFLRARANTIEGGTSEILRNQIAERVLGLPRDVEVDRDVPWKDIPRS